jgi:hypothetical protein
VIIMVTRMDPINLGCRERGGLVGACCQRDLCGLISDHQTHHTSHASLS